MASAHVAVPKSDSSDEANSECQRRMHARPEYVKIQNEEWNQTEATSKPKGGHKHACSKEGHSYKQRKRDGNDTGKCLQKHSAGVQAKRRTEEDIGAAAQPAQRLEASGEYGCFSLVHVPGHIISP